MVAGRGVCFLPKLKQMDLLEPPSIVKEVLAWPPKEPGWELLEI